MSNLETLLDSFPDFAKDIKLNAKSLILGESASLSKEQIAIISVACAACLKSQKFANIFVEHFSQSLSDSQINGAKTASALMSMNNIYYRFLHLTSNHEYQTMPAGLRMNAISSSGGIEKIDFELASIAISAINGCGMCVDSHEKTLKTHGVTSAAIQNAVKIAATINAVFAVSKIL